MVVQYKNFLLIVLTLAVIFSAFMIVVVNMRSPTVSSKQDALSGFMSSVIAIKMDKNGFPRTTLTAPLFQYYRTKNNILITKPHMKINPQSTALGNWAITANRAILFLSNKTIQLFGNVNIIRGKTHSLPKTTFITSSLTVNPDSNKAFTDKTVTIIQPNNKITSKGLRANLKTGVISLVSSTSGEFDPNSN